MMVVTTMQSSVTNAQGCPRTKTSGCAEYVKTYDKTVPQQVKVLDAVDAQLSYINLANENVNDDKVSVNYLCMQIAIPYSGKIWRISHQNTLASFKFGDRECFCIVQ